MNKNSEGRLLDAQNRHINYLRISITDRCNLRCVYCTPGKPFTRLSHKEILSYEEILRIARVSAKMGITKMRVTGGEPLIRKGSIEFLERLGAIEGIQDLSLTTNAVLLGRYVERLAQIGIHRLNISLDTLKPEKFIKITGQDHFSRVWDAIMRSLELGFSPIKINVVALNGINSDELEDLAALTFEYPFHVRFIEQMPFDGVAPDKTPPLLEDDIKARIAGLGPLVPVERSGADGPAKRYRLHGAAGEIGFISAVSHHFCSECNRLRLTADGMLRSCLLSDITTDIKTALRSGASDKEIADILLQAIRKKPRQHQLLSENSPAGRKMFSIGG